MQDDDLQSGGPAAGSAATAAPDAARSGSSGGPPSDVRAFFAGARALLIEDDGARNSKDRRLQFNEIITAYNEAESAAPAVVVVGEVGRGKSTLVNALLGGDYSPSGPGETTGTYLAFEPASEALPAGTAEVESTDGTRRRVPAAELERWVRVSSSDEGSEGEDPSDGEAATPVVLGVRVGVADPPFPGTTVVDTPGTGGLNPHHARVALARAERASLLLMVSDAGGVLTRPALEFLEECSDRVAAVVLVVTKIDNNPESWGKVAEGDRTALRASRRGRLHDAPIVAVSALDRLAAFRASTPERAARRYAASRFEVLVETVAGLLSKGDAPARANAVRRMQAVLEDVQRVLHADIAALGSAAASDAAEAALRELTAKKEQGAFWRLDLDTSIGRASREVKRETAARMRAFGEEWQSRLDRSTFGIGRSRAQRMHTDLTAELLSIIEDLRAFSHDRLVAALTSTLSGMGLPELLDAVVLEASDRELEVGTPRSARAQLDLSAAMIGYSGFRIATLAVGTGAVAALPVGAVALGLAAGAGMVVLNIMLRGGHARKAALQANLTKVLGEMRMELADDFGDAVLELKPTLLRIIDASMTKAIAELTQRVQAARRLQQAGEQNRQDTVAELEHRAAVARRVAATGETVVAAILSGDHRAASTS